MAWRERLSIGKHLLKLCFLAVCLPVTGTSFARPPPGPIDPAIAQWFHSLQHPGRTYPCCDLSDCRRVEARIVNGHYQATIRRKDYDSYEWQQRFGDAETATIDVLNEDIVIRNDNPTNSPVLCYSIVIGKVFCFVPWDFKG
jgi:hypothetical protein